MRAPCLNQPCRAWHACDKCLRGHSIQPDVLAHRDELSQFMGDEISRIIREQRALEKRYEELIAQRGALKAGLCTVVAAGWQLCSRSLARVCARVGLVLVQGLSNKTRYKENQREIQDVSRALRESTKKLCRNLKVPIASHCAALARRLTALARWCHRTIPTLART